MQRKESLLSIVVGLVVIAITVALCVKDCNEQEACRDAGGRVERYNFRTVWMPMSCGENCTTYVPVETSDWRCVDKKAERE